MKLSTIIYSTFLLGFLIVGWYSILGSLASDQGGYNVVINDSIKDNLNENLTTISEDLSDSYSDLTDNVTANSGLAYLALVPKVIVIFVKTIISPIQILFTIVTTLVAEFLLPAWVTSIVMGMLGAIVIFALVALMLRFRDV